MACLITPSGTMTHVKPANNIRFTLQELQALVGGYIEVVPFTDHLQCDMLCNETGRLDGLPHNPAASILAQQDLAGDILALRREEWEESETEGEE